MADDRLTLEEFYRGYTLGDCLVWNLRHAVYSVPPAMADEGPKPRAADDADAIQKAIREIQLAEQRRPISCRPGQHNFAWSAGGVYTCTVCLRGKPEDGR